MAAGQAVERVAVEKVCGLTIGWLKGVKNS
jgi:hypothetical protein